MPRVNAYLRFDGDCREAMEFYRTALGGNLTLTKARESPMAEQVPAEAQDKIIHSTLANGDLVLHGADICDGGELESGSSVALEMECGGEKELKELFSRLSAGGKVVVPVSKQPWGAVFGQLTDRFGTDWMLNFQEQAGQRGEAPGRASQV